MTDPRVSVSLRELEEYWTIDDVLSCHDALDALDAAEHEAAERATSDNPRSRT
jgi:hypothetical protein